jgi:hypothetical protein
MILGLVLLNSLAALAGRAWAEPVKAIATGDFLNSLGINSTFPDRGQPLDKTIVMLRYCGFRWVRGGIEGLSENGPTTIQTYLDLHRATGVRFSWGLGSGGTNLPLLLSSATIVDKAGALLSFEENNEPNNWGVTYHGEKGGGQAPTWIPVAKLERDLYQSVKADPILRRYPVWAASETGGERDNVGMQFLKIPQGADTLMPDGTSYADYANIHNYIYHPNSPNPMDNKTWLAADPTPACNVDGLYGDCGVTWFKHFQGYPQAQLNTLPRVTTETGAGIGGAVTEHLHALNLLSIYLDQFKRGYSYTSVYLLRDRTDEGPNQGYGFFQPDYKPRQAAVYLHNLTTLLADSKMQPKCGSLDYSLGNVPDTVHDLLLQRSDGVFELVVWDERLHGEDRVTVHFSSTRPEVTVYDPTTGADPVDHAANTNSIPLALSDHPMILIFAGK